MQDASADVAPPRGDGETAHSLAGSTRASRLGALAVRRWLVIAAPVLAGLLAIVGSVADPAAGEDGRALYEAYAAEPGRVQIKSLAYHFSYAMWVPMVFGLVGLARGRGGWLANLAGVLGLLGVTTMPGFILVDFYDSAVGRLFGIDAVVRANELAGEMVVLPLMAGTGAFGFIFALPVAVLAAWRARLVPWWALAGTLVGVGGFMWSATPPGTTVLAAGLTVLAVGLARIDLARWDRGAPAVPAAGSA